MSVQVEINIGEGFTGRHLSIELETEWHNDEEGHRDLTEIGEYGVILTGGTYYKGSNAVVAHFHHRYREDVLTLIMEAIGALRRAGVDQA